MNVVKLHHKWLSNNFPHGSERRMRDSNGIVDTLELLLPIPRSLLGLLIIVCGLLLLLLFGRLLLLFLLSTFLLHWLSEFQIDRELVKLLKVSRYGYLHD